MPYLVLFLGNSILLIALAIKWGIKLKIAVLWAVIMGVISCLAVRVWVAPWSELSGMGVVLSGLGQSILITLIVVMILFYRDPDRIVSDRERIILSPADGEVRYVKEIRNGEFPFSVKNGKRIPLTEFIDGEFLHDGGVQIGLGMNLLDVHVNRTPIKGKIVLLKRIPGHFSSLRKIESLLENERVLTIIEGSEIKVGVVQIASRLVRRIVSYVREGDEVETGMRMGMIRFGSQVDLLIPKKEGLRTRVRVGEPVKAGISIIAEY